MNSEQQIPEIAESERTPLVIRLLGIIDSLHQTIKQQAAEIEQLKAELRTLKELPPRPKIKPSKLESPAGSASPSQTPPRSPSKPRSAKPSVQPRKRIVDLTVPPESLPEGSTFKGYLEYSVQELSFFAEIITYRRQRFDTPNQGTLFAPLPKSQEILGGHFGPNLVAFILDQYFHQRVTQPRLLAQLHCLGIKISSAQLSHLLTHHADIFHREAQEILNAGLEVSDYIHVDDTGDRHMGKNGYMTVVGNDLFSYFHASDNKSRLNVLLMLRGVHQDYVLNDMAFRYMQAQEISPNMIDKLKEAAEKQFANEQDWLAHLSQLGIHGEASQRTVTEAAVLGSVIEHGANPQLCVLSDGAKQFDLVVLLHALCWIHALRPLERLAVVDNEYQKELDRVFESVWKLYGELKAYKEKATEEEKKRLAEEFDKVFGQESKYESIKEVLKRIKEKKAELLRVLERKEVPLHNNGAEQDIREQTQRRKISGTTRSEAGKKARDTFMSLVKTCMKLGVSFYEYLKDRLSGENKIARLAELIRQKAAGKAATSQAAQAKPQGQDASGTPKS